MLDEQQLRCVECYGPLNSNLTCGQCGLKYERAATGAPILMTASDRERFGVLLESERQVCAELQLLEEGAERAKAKGPETVEELRSAHDHNCAYAVLGSSPF